MRLHFLSLLALALLTAACQKAGSPEPPAALVAGTYQGRFSLTSAIPRPPAYNIVFTQWERDTTFQITVIDSETIQVFGHNLKYVPAGQEGAMHYESPLKGGYFLFSDGGANSNHSFLQLALFGNAVYYHTRSGGVAYGTDYEFSGRKQ